MPRVRARRRSYAGVVPETREIPIRGRMIRLGQLLQHAGVVDGGGEAKALLEAIPVLVNGEPDARRGRQLLVGDVVRVGEDELRITAQS